MEIIDTDYQQQNWKVLAKFCKPFNPWRSSFKISNSIAVGCKLWLCFIFLVAVSCWLIFLTSVCATWQEIHEKMRERGEIREGEGITTQNNINSQGGVAGATRDGNNGLISSTLVNICVIIGFAAFAYTVKCVLKAVDNS